MFEYEKLNEDLQKKIKNLMKPIQIFVIICSLLNSTSPSSYGLNKPSIHATLLKMNKTSKTIIYID